MTAESTLEVPTNASVAGIFDLDVVPNRLAALIGEAQVELGGLLEIVDELTPQWFVEAELGPELVEPRFGDVATTKEGRNRIGLDDAKEEEVEDEDKSERENRSNDLPQCEPGVHSRSSAVACFLLAFITRRRMAARTTAPPTIRTTGLIPPPTAPPTGRSWK